MIPRPTFSATRRLLLAAPCALLACAGVPVSAPPPPAAPGEVTLLPWRSVNGGFVSAPAPGLGMPARPGTGPFAQLVAPTAVALVDQDLLVADSGTQRLWRIDLMLGALVPQGGVAVSPTTALALAPDRSAWVLDGMGGVLRHLARDGRVLQTFRPGADLAAASGIALADLGATVLLADAGLGQWLELRAGGGLALPVRPLSADGRSIAVDAMAAGGSLLWVLDKRAGLVHRVDRGGRVLASLGAGVLQQPVAIAADARGRVWVLDGQDHRLVLLREGVPVQAFGASALRVRQPAAIAADERGLAVADRLGGQVVLLRVQEARP